MNSQNEQDYNCTSSIYDPTKQRQVDGFPTQCMVINGALPKGVTFREIKSCQYYSHLHYIKNERSEVAGVSCLVTLRWNKWRKKLEAVLPANRLVPQI